MTMLTHTDIAAPIRPQIRPKFSIMLELPANLAKLLVQAHRHNRDAQKLRRAHKAILKDVGLTRVKANGKTFLF